MKKSNFFSSRYFQSILTEYFAQAKLACKATEKMAKSKGGKYFVKTIFIVI